MVKQTRNRATGKELTILKDWLRAKEMTQSRLASAVGLSEAMVSKVLKGTQPFSLATAFEVSFLTGIPVERLVAPGRARRILELFVKRLRSTGEIAKDSSDVA